MRAAGAGYMEIARRGGGIHASVRDVRARSEGELVDLADVAASPRLRRTARPRSRSSPGTGSRSRTSSSCCA